MKRFVVSSALLSALFLSTAPAHAQEQGQIGFVMSLPADVGLLWHVSDNIAVRPEINFSFGSSEGEIAGLATETSRRGFSFETSVLFYLDAVDNVRTYVSPRVGFDWSTADDSDSVLDVSGDGIEVSVSYGAQYTPVRRFSVFGEIGLEYARSTATVDLGPGGEVETRSSGWGPRTQVGVILYFN